MFLDFGVFRAVHACWCEKSIRLLDGASLKDPEFLILANTEGTPEFEAVERILKGPEAPLPPGMSITDKDGTSRDRIRITWWGHGSKPRPISEIFMPPGGILESRLLPAAVLSEIPTDPSAKHPLFSCTAS